MIKFAFDLTILLTVLIVQAVLMYRYIAVVEQRKELFKCVWLLKVYTWNLQILFWYIGAFAMLFRAKTYESCQQDLSKIKNESLQVQKIFALHNDKIFQAQAKLSGLCEECGDAGESHSVKCTRYDPYGIH